MQFRKKHVQHQGGQRWLRKGSEKRASFDFGAAVRVGLSIDKSQDIDLVLTQCIFGEDMRRWHARPVPRHQRTSFSEQMLDIRVLRGQADHQSRLCGGQIDQLRLDDEYEIRRKETAAKAAEIDRLKSQARKEIADMEARVNTRPMSKEEAARVMDWADVNMAPDNATVTGNLIRVDCAGKQLTLSVKDGRGKIWRMLIADPTHVEVKGEVKGGQALFNCGVQKPRGITVRYTGTGDVTGIEFRR